MKNIQNIHRDSADSSDDYDIVCICFFAQSNREQIMEFLRSVVLQFMPVIRKII